MNKAVFTPRTTIPYISAIAIAANMVIATSANAAMFTLSGDQIDAEMIRTVDTGYGLGRIYGYGLESPFIVQDGAADERQYSSTFYLNVDGDKFNIRFTTSAGWQEGILFRLSDLDFNGLTPNALTSLTVDTNLLGYTLNIGTDFVEVGLGGTQFNSNTYFTGTFSVSQVPIPAAAWLFGSGLMGFAGAAYRRHRNGL